MRFRTCRSAGYFLASTKFFIAVLNHSALQASPSFPQHRTGTSRTRRPIAGAPDAPRKPQVRARTVFRPNRPLGPAGLDRGKQTEVNHMDTMKRFTAINGNFFSTPRNNSDPAGVHCVLFHHYALNSLGLLPVSREARAGRGCPPGWTRRPWHGVRGYFGPLQPFLDDGVRRQQHPLQDLPPARESVPAGTRAGSDTFGTANAASAQAGAKGSQGMFMGQWRHQRRAATHRSHYFFLREKFRGLSHCVLKDKY
jgi:hypothetical protein